MNPTPPPEPDSSDARRFEDAVRSVAQSSPQPVKTTKAPPKEARIKHKPRKR